MARSKSTTDQSYGVVAALTATPEPTFLLVQHRAGHWGFPKGHPEGEESPRETAAREFREETGVREFSLLPADPVEERYSFRSRGLRVDKTVLYFMARAHTDRVSIQQKEIRDHAWLQYEAARERLSFDEARAVLDQAYPHFQDDSDNNQHRQGDT